MRLPSGELRGPKGLLGPEQALDESSGIGRLFQPPGLQLAGLCEEEGASRIRTTSEPQAEQKKVLWRWRFLGP